MENMTPEVIDDPNGWIEVVAGHVVHVAAGCSVVAHPGTRILVEGGARCHAYDGASVFLLDRDAVCCYDGAVLIEGVGFHRRHVGRRDKECLSLIRRQTK